MPRLLVERGGRGAQLRQLAGLQPLVLGDAAAAGSRSRCCWYVIGRPRLSLNTLAGDEALARRAAAAARTGAAPWRRSRSASIQRALVGEAGLLQRQLLAAHVVELLLDLGLAGERRQLQVGVGQDGEQLALADHGAVLDQHLLDPAALDRVEIDGDERRRPARAAAGNRRTCPASTVEMVSRSRLTVWESGARREQPEQQDQQQGRAGAAADQDALVDPLALDDAVHRAAADGARPRASTCAIPPGSLSASGQSDVRKRTVMRRAVWPLRSARNVDNRLRYHARIVASARAKCRIVATQPLFVSGQWR